MAPNKISQWSQGKNRNTAVIGHDSCRLCRSWWTYNLFIKERKEYPHANIEIKVSHVVLSKQANLLRLETELTNTGSSLMKIGTNKDVDAGIKDVQSQNDRFPWPLIAERNNDSSFDVEPGEKQSVDVEFATSADVKVVRVYAYFRNDQRSTDNNEVGWAASGYYDFRKTAGAVK